METVFWQILLTCSGRKNIINRRICLFPTRFLTQKLEKSETNEWMQEIEDVGG
jgi:hypothetical protein